uniref:Homeobox domain-containing protein n=1 Tax=Bionectria ochroleuca TaxID=29856 RepID=A0A8H7N987_BIOOC
MSSDLQPATASSEEQQRATITPPIATQQDLESSFLSQNSDHDTSISSVENGEKHPKARRKRTTAKDKMILEEAYSRNPKPDKQARLEIVERVSLNEKEVQIWFQNRRQNDRRKSRPLSPQEIAALRYNGSQNVGESFIPQVMNGAPELAVFSVSETPAPPPLLAAVPSTSPSQIAPNPAPNPSLPPNIPETPAAPVPPRALPEATPPQLSNQEASFSSSQESLPASQSFSSSVGYLANRWNIGSSFNSTPPSHGSGVEETPKSENYISSSSPHTSQSGSQPRSHVRLSLSLEGKAELVSNDASPSRQPPPRPSSTIDTLPQPRPRSLQRSHSAMPSITLPPISALTNSLPLHGCSGGGRVTFMLGSHAQTRIHTISSRNRLSMNRQVLPSSQPSPSCALPVACYSLAVLSVMPRCLGQRNDHSKRREPSWAEPAPALRVLKTSYIAQTS